MRRRVTKPDASQGFNKNMILGSALMLIGCLLVIRNKEIAVYTGTTTQKGFYSHFSTSAARQNIAIVGALLFGAGFAAFLFV